MDMSRYQELALRTMRPGVNGLAMGVMGMCGEAGEACDIAKKHLFNGHRLDRQKLVSELGDVLWYVACTADAIGFDLGWVAQYNIEKLKERYPNGYSDGASIERRDLNG